MCVCVFVKRRTKSILFCQRKRRNFVCSYTCLCIFFYIWWTALRFCYSKQRDDLLLAIGIRKHFRWIPGRTFFRLWLGWLCLILSLCSKWLLMRRIQRLDWLRTLILCSQTKAVLKCYKVTTKCIYCFQKHTDIRDEVSKIFSGICEKLLDLD